MSVAIPDDAVAVVFDLDGTLVRLAVDWSALAESLRHRFAEAGVEADGWSVWDCYDRAAAHGLQTEVEALIAERELAGAEAAERLQAADDLLALDRPAAICSLNSEAACRAALERHGLLDAVVAVVGRDTVGPVKPDPGPLLAAVEALGVEPSTVVFVGNREKDAETAKAAGTAFTYVGGDGPTE